MARIQPFQNFHAFTIKYNGSVKRITTELVVLPAFDPATPPPVGHMATALWDTGATMSLITPQVAERLNLSPVGTLSLSHVGGSGICKTYVVNLGLPNKVMVSGVLVAEGIIGGGVDAIIGMDVICKGDFAITNVNGETRMSFRYPSVGTIDYVVEANKIVYAGINRNAPCPCGAKDKSGKSVRYKHCHGAAR